MSDDARRAARGEAGSVMPMTAILVAFLVTGAWALVSASQQWTARRDAYSAAAAAARAAAQADPITLRSGGVLDPDGARERATAVLTATGHTGIVSIDGEDVTVVVTATVDYAFPSPGFPTDVTGRATAFAHRGVTGDEIGG